MCDEPALQAAMWLLCLVSPHEPLERWCKRMMSHVMATGKTAIPFSFAARAARANSKLATRSIKAVKQVDGWLEAAGNDDLVELSIVALHKNTNQNINPHIKTTLLAKKYKFKILPTEHENQDRKVQKVVDRIPQWKKLS